jgi:hypothetical protein
MCVDWWIVRKRATALAAAAPRRHLRNQQDGQWELADLGAAGILGLVELALLAFVEYLGLPDPLHPPVPHSDNLKYLAMAHHPFGSDPLVHIGPFCWRVLTPWIVHLLAKAGLSLQNGFLLVTMVSLTGVAIGTYALVRFYGAARPGALTVALLVQTQYALTDQLLCLLVVIAFLLYELDQPRWLVLVLALGAMERETILIAVAAFAGEQIVRRDWQRLRTFCPAYIAPVGVLVVLHAFIHSSNRNILLAQLLYFWDLRWTHGWSFAFAQIYALTVNSYGLLLPLLLLQVIHAPAVTCRPLVWLCLIATLTQILISGSNERLMIVAFPVFAMAAWFELRWIAERLELPPAAIGCFLVAVQILFLVGQFYFIPADQGREPQWLHALWPWIMTTVAGAAVWAAFWVLGAGISRLYRRALDKVAGCFRCGRSAGAFVFSAASAMISRIFARKERSFRAKMLSGAKLTETGEIAPD